MRETSFALHSFQPRKPPPDGVNLSLAHSHTHNTQTFSLKLLCDCAQCVTRMNSDAALSLIPTWQQLETRKWNTNDVMGGLARATEEKET